MKHDPGTEGTHQTRKATAEFQGAPATPPPGSCRSGHVVLNQTRNGSWSVRSDPSRRRASDRSTHRGRWPEQTARPIPRASALASRRRVPLGLGVWRGGPRCLGLVWSTCGLLALQTRGCLPRSVNCCAAAIRFGSPSPPPRWLFCLFLDGPPDADIERAEVLFAS